MSGYRRSFFNSKVKWLITFILLTVLSVAVIFAFVKIDKNEKTKELGQSSFTYAIGILNAEGEYEQGTTSIYTRNFYSVDGLTCNIDEKATITYKIVFYDVDEKFVDATDELSTDYDGTSVPTTAEYFKVMITPTNDAEVSLFEIGDYAGQLTVTIDK